ncbi:MAG: hypothetical protein ACI81R_002764 [Bradymonadia bacterium]
MPHQTLLDRSPAAPDRIIAVTLHSAQLRAPTSLLLALAGVSLLLSSACSSLDPPVRRTLLAPNAHVPHAAGAPMEAGEFRGQFSLFVAPNASFGDGLDDRAASVSGAYVPRLELGGHIGYAPTNVVSVHFAVIGTTFDWSRPANASVPAPTIPARAFSVGAGVRLQAPLPNPNADLALMADLDVLTAPEQIWRCTLESSLDTSAEREACLNRPEDVDITRREYLRLRPTLGVQFGYRVLPWLHPWTLLSIQTGYENVRGRVERDGVFDIDPDAFNDESIATYPLFNWALGADVMYNAFIGGVHVQVPFGGPPETQLTPGVVFRLGARFGGENGPNNRPEEPAATF